MDRKILIGNAGEQSHICTHAPDGRDEAAALKTGAPDLAGYFHGAFVISESSDLVGTSHRYEIYLFTFILIGCDDLRQYPVIDLVVTYAGFRSFYPYIRTHDTVQQQIG